MIKNLPIDFFKAIVTDNGNSFRYRLIFAFCFVVHAFYALLFAFVSVTELMLFNICSTLMYGLGLFLIKNNRFTALWMFLLNAEVIAHAFVCGYFLGNDYLFSLLSFTLIPVTYFLTYLDPTFRKPLLTSSLLAVINAGVLVYVQYCFNLGHFTPLYPNFPFQFVNGIALLNLSIASLVLICFSVTFVGKISTDIKEMEETNKKLDFLATYDQLTGLRSRNKIRDIFVQYTDSPDPYCVIIGDIDDFKHVNDTYGHSAGDDVLRTVSSIIKDSVGSRGEVCRWGGEEILVLLKGSFQECAELNQKILEEIRNTTITSGDNSINVSMTFGLCPRIDGSDIEKLISLADKRLYIGKRSGKNKIVTADK